MPSSDLITDGDGSRIVNMRLDQLENVVATLSSKLRTVTEDLEAVAEDLFMEGIDVLEQRVEKMEILLMRIFIEQSGTTDKDILISPPQCVKLNAAIDATTSRITSMATGLECPQLVQGYARESDPDRELQDELSFMLLIGTLESKFEICEQLFSNGSNDKIWDDHIYPIIAKHIEESLQRPSTELSNVEVEERYPGMMQSELWRNVCDAVPCTFRHSDAFLEISYAAFKFHERILQSRT